MMKNSLIFMFYEGVKVGYYHQEEVTVVMNDNRTDDAETEGTDESADDSTNTVSNDREVGKGVVAMVNIMNKQDDVYPPSAGYYQIIADGYKDFGFDKRILSKALSESNGRMNG